MRNQLFLSAILITAILSVLPHADAQSVPDQTTPGNADGVMPYNTYGGARENINLSTGNLNLQIPLLALPGRNGLNFSLGLAYDSKRQDLYASFDPDTGTYTYWFDGEFRDPQPPQPNASYGGWRFALPLIQVTATQQGVQGSTYCYKGFIVTTSDGGKHSFPNNKVHCFLINSHGQPVLQPQLNVPTITDAGDASGLRLDTTNENDIVVHLKNGTVIHFYASFTSSVSTAERLADKIEDTNGNVITIQSTGYYPGNITPISITDTLGRQVTFSSGSSCTAGGSTCTISYKDSSGTTRTISIAWSGSTMTVTMPNGLSYIWDDSAQKLTYPTGGYTRYDTGTFTAWWFVGHSAPGTPDDYTELTAKHVCPLAAGNCSPSQEYTTTYTPTIDGAKASNQYMDVVDPLNNKTHYQFSFSTSSYTTVAFSPRELSRQVYQGQSTLLRTIQTDYNLADGNGNPTAGSLPIRTTTTLNDVSPTLVTKTESDYDTYVPPGGSSTSIDNVIEQREYGYGQNAPGNLLRRTDYTWLKTNSVNGQDYTSTAIHIMDRKASELVYDGSSSLLAQTTYEYDNFTGSLTSSGAVQHDSGFGTGYTYRGNLTATKRWRNTDSTWLTTRNQFDDAGNITQTADPAGHTTTFSHADSWGNTACTPSGGSAAAYLTQVKNALNQIANFTYNSCAGTKSSMTDPNLQPTSYSYDKMNRFVQASYPDGGQTNVAYNESSFPLNVQTTKKITGSLNLINTATVDGIGNVYQTQLNSDPDGVVYTDTTYDALERKSTVSNPYRSTSDSTYGITTYNYDALNRVPKLIPPDGSPSSNNVTTTFSGNCTTVTDEAGKIRKSCSDGLGRLTQVFEPDGSNSLVNETDYTYDALNNLLTVNQKGNTTDTTKWRTRTFTYDSLSELTSAANPESGAITYSYDNDGNVHTKADARGITITYSYDAVNRLTGKSYSNGDPSVRYSYDQSACLGQPSCYNIGRRTGMTDAAGSEAWSYEKMGRPKVDQRMTNSITKSSTYNYNLDGSLSSVVYPLGRTITYAAGGAGRPLSAIDQNNSINYATSAHYAPPGELAAMQNGASVNLTNIYNNRLQPCWMYATTGTALAWGSTTQCTSTASTGNLLDLKYNLNWGASDNGNVMGITNNRDTTRSQTFAYDTLNRIATAETTSTYATSPAHCWGESYVFDNSGAGGPWGNLTNINAASSAYNGCTQESLNMSAANNNQISGFCYDLAGNLLAQSAPPCPAPTYSYNAEGQMISTAGVTYTYDGDGKRVKKSNSTLYWYGMGSDALDETDLSGNLTNEYVFFGGQRIARRDSGSNIYYYFEDHLGTSRVITNASGSPCYDADFYPFGGERTAYTNTCPQNYKFTGKERDSESNLDNFGARYDSSSLGRFMSPDIGAFHFGNPQSLNRYTYALNNPLFYIDPDGEDSISAVYRLGTASVNTFVPSGQTVDNAALLAGVAGPGTIPLERFQQSQSMIAGGSGAFSKFMPSPSDIGGGCTLGCVSTFNQVPVGLSLSLSFSYDDKTGQITGANIQATVNPEAAFIGPNPPAQRAAFQPFPGMTLPPEVFEVNINSSILRKLTPAQIQALDKATAGKTDAISQTVQKAVSEEEKRRAEEQEKERRKRCQQAGKNDCV